MEKLEGSLISKLQEMAVDAGIEIYFEDVDISWKEEDKSIIVKGNLNTNKD